MGESFEIGRMVRFHRKKAKLSQLELAKLAGVGKTAVFDIEQGKETVRLLTLMKVFYALSIRMEFNGPIMHLYRKSKMGQYDQQSEPSVDWGEKFSDPLQSREFLPFKEAYFKTARVYVSGVYAGNLEEIAKGKEYRFVYLPDYFGDPISLTMPIAQSIYLFDRFPPFFDNLLPEGPMLEALLKRQKIDANDQFEQLMRVGKEMVGNVTVERTF